MTTINKEPTMSDLLPCPFCGGGATVFYGGERNGIKYESVSCETKGCEVAETAGYPVPHARNRWNRRAISLPPQPPLDEEVAAMIRYLNGNGEGLAADLIERLARDLAAAQVRAGDAHRQSSKDMLDAHDWQARAEKAEAEVARLQDLLNKTAANNRTKARALRGRKGADHG